MKKLLLSAVIMGLVSGVFGQGTVILENAVGTGNVTIVDWDVFPNTSEVAPAGVYQVALLWYNGTTFVQVGAVYQTSTANHDGTGFFNGETVTVPTYSATGTFEVEGWTGNSSNYEAAIDSGIPTAAGVTAPFTNAEGNPATPTPPVPISGGPGGWDGNLVLVGDYVITGTPEPSTLALGSVGATALWLFRRRR